MVAITSNQTKGNITNSKTKKVTQGFPAAFTPGANFTVIGFWSLHPQRFGFASVLGLREVSTTRRGAAFGLTVTPARRILAGARASAST